MRLARKTAIVTGASSGIGRAIALRFAAEGANVVIADVTPHPREGGKPTEELATKSGGTAIFLRTDVSHWANVEGVVTETVERFGRLDVMVNNAAISLGKPLLATTEADWQQVMAVNLTGVYFGCKRAIQQMRGQEIVGEARGGPVPCKRRGDFRDRSQFDGRRRLDGELKQRRGLFGR